MDFLFIPGQATGVSINKPEWKDIKRPFTFTSIPSNEYLEFTIKSYPDHQGVTNQLVNLREGDELILHETFGNIIYREEGVFIAAGAGVTPFISIFRELEYSNLLGNNKLIFANKTHHDIINEIEFNNLLGDKFVNILSEEDYKKYDYGLITEEYLLNNCDLHNQMIYLCGPPEMMQAIELILYKLDINKKLIITEAF